MMRKSGILLPISSLPSRYGIGCFSIEAYEFIDQLKEAGQTYWQILPLGPIGYGDSPYQSFSTFAGNPYYINLDQLVSYGWLTEEECMAVDFEEGGKVHYGKLYEGRYPLLRKAFNRSNIAEKKEFHEFLEREQNWIEDYALFMAVKDQYQGKCWNTWEKGIRDRDEAAIAQKKEELKDEILFYQFLQYEFRKQWYGLKQYANSQGIKIVGDIPIYVSYDSADAWANKELFQFDEEGNPKAIAGVPPDGFSATGQLWGNPLYDWEYHAETGYDWWVQRLSFCYEMYDVVRIDHFRGFDEYYSIPYGDENAMRGHWEQGPGYALFKKVKEVLGEREIIAEDLGYVTDTVRQLVKDTGYPGMKVLEFAFDSRDSGSAQDYLPHNYQENSVVYTGTHDNETLIGWFCEGVQDIERQMVREYLCVDQVPDEQMHIPMICAAMRSVSKLCMIPMQDWLGLDNSARMNQPSTTGENWKWRMSHDDFNHELRETIFKITKRYGR